jgi:acyl-coenzyme A synthetase/AMP-(fatty) acid ligase
MNVSTRKKQGTSFVRERLWQLLESLPLQNNSFVCSGRSFRDIYILASHIKETLQHDFEPHRPVCLCTENKEVIASLILASLAGGPDIIIPYSYSPHVLKEVKEAIGFTRAIVDAQCELPDDVKTYNFNDWEDSGEVFKKLQLERDLNSEFLKLFTGGTTGKPKIWSKTPLNIFSEGIYLANKLAFTENDKIQTTVPPYHIYGFLFSIILPLISGAAVVQEVCTFPGEIISNIQTKKATVLVSVPMHYRVLKKIDCLHSQLRLAVSSAGALDPADAASFFRQTGIGVTEIYGSTETGGIATRDRARGEESLTPFDVVRWKIVDERLAVNSDFISSELPRDGEGFFITGDRVKNEAGNSFMLLGRADGVVKVGGKRVDLYDVHVKLKGIEGVRDALVISFPLHNGRENEIVALVESSVNENVLRLQLQNHLEPYAMPRRIRIIEKMPLLSTGKFDRVEIEKIFAG